MTIEERKKLISDAIDIVAWRIEENSDLRFSEEEIATLGTRLQEIDNQLMRQIAPLFVWKCVAEGPEPATVEDMRDWYARQSVKVPSSEPGAGMMSHKLAEAT